MTGQVAANSVTFRLDPSAISLESLSVFEDIEITLSVELARREMSVQELLQLEEGHVIKFSRPIGEDVDLFAGDVLIASAEILVFDGQLTARVAEIQDNANAAQKSDR